MQQSLVFKKVQFMLASNFQQLPHSLTILKNDKEKFTEVLRKYLHTPFTL